MLSTEFIFFLVRVTCDLWRSDVFCLEKLLFKGVTPKWFVSWFLGASEAFLFFFFFVLEEEEVS